MDSRINATLKNFVNKLWDLQDLTVSKDDLIEIEILENGGIVTSSDGNYSVKDFEMLAPTFLEIGISKIGFEESQEFASSEKFIKELKELFCKENFISDYRLLEKEIRKLLIVSSNQRFQNDFEQHLKNISQAENDDTLFYFTEAYSEVLVKLDLDVKTIYNNAVRMTELSASEAIYNANLAAIRIGLRKLVEINESIGLELFSLAIKDQQPIVDVCSTIITGLYNLNGIEFFRKELSPFIDLAAHKSSILLGIIQVKIITDVEFELFLELFDEHQNDQSVTVLLCRMLFAPLLQKQELALDQECSLKIFERIRKVALLDESNLIHYIIHELTFLKNYDDQKLLTLELIIQQPHFCVEKYGKTIGQVFWYTKEVPFLRSVLLSIAQSQPHVKIADKWDLHGFDSVQFDKMVVDFLTSDLSSQRFLALDILNDTGKKHHRAFAFDILTLAPSIQYKLWVSLTQDYREPKEIIKKLIPLLDSPSSTVRNSFLCKLEEYTENFGQAVVDALKECLDLTKSEHREALGHVQQYLKSFHASNVLPKLELKELNPHFTHSKLVQDFHKIHGKDFSEKMSKSVEENSFLSFFSSRNILLMKGGGFKFGDNREVSKLSKFETSFSLPRDFFIFPNKYEMEESAKLYRDWQPNEFEIIQKLIDAEQ